MLGKIRQQFSSQYFFIHFLSQWIRFFYFFETRYISWIEGFFHIECFRVFYVNSHLHFFLLHQYTFVNCILCSWGNETEKCPPTIGQKSCVISPETVAHLCHFLGWRIYCSFFGKICLEPWFIFIDVLLFHLYLYIFVTRKFILGLGASESRRLLGAVCVVVISVRKGEAADDGETARDIWETKE